MGTPLLALTLIHVVISLIGILSGAVVSYGMIASRRMERWTALFLVTTVLTSATGFLFPFEKLLPSHIVGAISLVVLATAIPAYYHYRLAGAWRWVYVATSVFAFYLNVFVAIVQAFLKIAPLKAIAPTQSDPSFIIAQLVVLLAFLVLGALAVRTYHPTTVPAKAAV